MSREPLASKMRGAVPSMTLAKLEQERERLQVKLQSMSLQKASRAILAEVEAELARRESPGAE